MVFIRKKLINGKEYYYLVKSKRRGTTVKKTERYVGLNKPSEKDIENFEKEMDETRTFLLKKQTTLTTIKEAFGKIFTGPTDAVNSYEENFITHFTYDSNRIEGSSMTYKNTHLLFQEGISPHNKPLRDIKETENHRNAFFFIKNYEKEIDISLILELHRLLKHTISEDAGRFRNAGVRFGPYVGMNHNLIKTELRNLIKWYKSSQDHLFQRIAQFHCTFERIHPFFDGNGRVGRLLINYALQRERYPYIIIKNKNKKRYYSALNKGHVGNYLFFVKLIVAEMEEQYRMYIEPEK